MPSSSLIILSCSLFHIGLFEFDHVFLHSLMYRILWYCLEFSHSTVSIVYSELTSELTQKTGRSCRRDSSSWPSNSDNNSVQLWCEGKHLRMYSMSNLEMPGLQQQTTMSGSAFRQPRKESWGCGGHRFTKTEKKKAWSEESGFVLRNAYGRVGTNTMNPWTHPALCQQSRLVEVM